MKISLVVLGSVVLLASHASTSLAQAPRTFVSGLGNDGNPCTRIAPCRNFAQAISQTSAGGEVVALDSAGYGAFSITQAVSIIAPPGVYAGISVFSGNGITINAGASDTVILRGLTVNNQGSTGSGISFNSGGTLHVESCVVNGFNLGQFGIVLAGNGALEVKESIIRASSVGIEVAGFGSAVVDNVRLERNGCGLVVEGGSHATVRDSVAAGNLSDGLAAESFFASAPAELNVENCLVSNNFFGISADWTSGGGAVTVRVSNSTVTDNHFGFVANSGPVIILSRGNNTVEGNAIDTSGNIATYTAK